VQKKTKKKNKVLQSKYKAMYTTRLRTKSCRALERERGSNGKSKKGKRGRGGGKRIPVLHVRGANRGGRGGKGWMGEWGGRAGNTVTKRGYKIQKYTRRGTAWTFSKAGKNGQEGLEEKGAPGKGRKNQG